MERPGKKVCEEQKLAAAELLSGKRTIHYARQGKRVRMSCGHLCKAEAPTKSLSVVNAFTINAAVKTEHKKVFSTIRVKSSQLMFPQCQITIGVDEVHPQLFIIHFSLNSSHFFVLSFLFYTPTTLTIFTVKSLQFLPKKFSCPFIGSLKNFFTEIVDRTHFLL